MQILNVRNTTQDTFILHTLDKQWISKLSILKIAGRKPPNVLHNSMGSLRKVWPHAINRNEGHHHLPEVYAKLLHSAAPPSGRLKH